MGFSVSEVLVGLLAVFTAAQALPLDDYVQKDDGAFSWYDTGVEINGRTGRHNDKASWTGKYLNVTTQYWLTPDDSSQPVWWNMVLYMEPDDKSILRTVPEGENTTIILYNTGHHENDMPGPTDEEVFAAGEFMVNTGCPVVMVFQIPNEPITFPTDPLNKSRSEDAIIAFTWNHFIHDPSNPEWVLQLPMVKSVYKSMDAIEEYLNLENSVNWVVSGASKRGWTTWLTACADAAYKKRVVAIAPMVYDELNFRENLHHHYRAYGGWSFAFEDYWDENVTMFLDDDNSTILFDIIDPLAYKERLTMPKLIIDATGDEFFLLDDWAYWINLGLPGVNHFLMSPNTEHSLATGIFEIVPAICAFMNGLLDYGVDSIPQYTWSVDNTTGNITVVVDGSEDAIQPQKVTMWYAETCNTERRDFRMLNIDDPCTCGVTVDGDCLNLEVFWSEEVLQPEADGVTYIAHRDPPDDGRWGAFLVDLKYPLTNGMTWPVDQYHTYEFTTQVSIVPDTFPFEDCSGEDCKGVLV